LRCTNDGGSLQQFRRNGLGWIFFLVLPGFLYSLDICAVAVTCQHLRVVDTHPADIKSQGPGSLETRRGTVVLICIFVENDARHIRRNSRAVRRSAGYTRAFIKLRAQFTPFIARPVDRQHTISDFTRLHYILRSHGRNVDRQVCTRWFETQLEAAFKIEELSVIDQFFAAQDHPDNLDILTRALHGFLKRDTMPVFDHICP